jgi:hypothetical protein
MLPMLASPVESPAMPRRPDKPVSDDDVVRYTALMTRGLRNRFGAFCKRMNEDMEDLGARWIAARLDEEEAKLLKAPRKKN